jgi:beta-glucosidase
VAEEQPAVVRPRKELKGIARVDLPLKGSEVVKVNLDRNAFKYWNSRTKSWSVKAGMFELLIGESAEKIVARQTVSVDNGETWLGL